MEVLLYHPLDTTHASYQRPKCIPGVLGLVIYTDETPEYYLLIS
jgi:hypothetical protein